MLTVAREFIKLGLVQNELILERGNDMAKEMGKGIRLTY